MKKFILLPLLFFIAGCGPEYGVSQKGITICLRRSNEASNKFTAEKIYKRCLKKIDIDISKKKELANEVGKKYWSDFYNYEKNLNKQEKARYKKLINERKEKVKLFEKDVLEMKDEFVKDGWTSIYEGKWNWALGRDRRIAYKDFVVMRYYLLPKFEKPKFTPKSYFSKQRLFDSYRDEIDGTNDPSAWVVFDCVTGETQTIKNKDRVFNTKDIDPFEAGNIINNIPRMNPPRKKGPIPAISKFGCQLINNPSQTDN